MPLRSYASSTLSIAELLIPVKLYSPGKKDDELVIKTVHLGCGGALKEEKRCVKCNELVPKEKVAKGYEYSPDSVMELTEAEFKSLREEGDASINVTASIPPDFVPTHYLTDGLAYLGPNKGGHHLFAAFASALSELELGFLAESNRAGSQTNVLLTAEGNGLVMHALRWGDEVQDIAELEPLDATVSAAHEKLTAQIVRALKVKKFDPYASPNRKKQRLKELLDERVRSGKVTLLESKSGVVTELSDLTSALERSLISLDKMKAAPRGRA